MLYCDRRNFNFYEWFFYFCVHGDRQRNNIYLQHCYHHCSISSAGQSSWEHLCVIYLWISILCRLYKFWFNSFGEIPVCKLFFYWYLMIVFIFFFISFDLCARSILLWTTSLDTFKISLILWGNKPFVSLQLSL